MADRRPRLAIVGASVRAAAFSALRGGFDVVAADMFADADLARHVDVAAIESYPAGLPAWLARTACDAWLYTGALENHADLVREMSVAKPLVGNSFAVLGVVRDPAAMQRLLDDAGLHTPSIRHTAPTLHGDEAWLCKTYRGSSGAGVWRLDGLAATERAQREQAVFQRYIHGEPAAAIFVVAADRARPLGVTRQILRGGEHPWQYAGSLGPLACSAEVESQLARLGELLREVGVRGIVGVDLVLDGDRAWIIEVNPRYTASVELLERSAGISAIAAHVAACDPALALPDVPASAAATDAWHAKRIVFAERDVRASPAFHAWAMEHSSLEPASCTLADIPQAGETIPAGRPVLTAFASGATEEDATDELRRHVGEVERRLYDA